MVDEEGTTSTIDFAERRLCPDGECTGVLGADGICQHCGKAGGKADVSLPGASGHSSPGVANWVGDLDEPGSGTVSASESMAPGDQDHSEDGETGADIGSLQIEGDLDERELCADGNCVGLIGPDRRCKVCGLPAPHPRSQPG